MCRAVTCTVVLVALVLVGCVLLLVMACVSCACRCRALALLASRRRLLEARGVISVTERTATIARIRHLARQVAEAWLAEREALGFPLLKQQEVVAV